MTPISAHVSGALDALTASKPAVLGAVAHLTADLPRARLLSLRLAPSVANATEARRTVDALGSAALLEHLSAMPFELAGTCDEALEVRLDALRIAPRYDPWLGARILAGATHCLLKARRHEEVRARASRSLAFLPGVRPRSTRAGSRSCRTSCGTRASLLDGTAASMMRL